MARIQAEGIRFVAPGLEALTRYTAENRPKLSKHIGVVAKKLAKKRKTVRGQHD